MVKLLLDKGADVNAQGGRYGNALYVASERGHEQVVKLLLDKGADVSAEGRRYDNALQAASAKGHEEVEKAERAREEAEKETRKTTLSEFLNGCHVHLYSGLTIQTDAALSTRGDPTNANNKIRPESI